MTTLSDHQSVRPDHLKLWGIILGLTLGWLVYVLYCAQWLAQTEYMNPRNHYLEHTSPLPRWSLQLNWWWSEANSYSVIYYVIGFWTTIFLVVAIIKVGRALARRASPTSPRRSLVITLITCGLTVFAIVMAFSLLGYANDQAEAVAGFEDSAFIALIHQFIVLWRHPQYLLIIPILMEPFAEKAIPVSPLLKLLEEINDNLARL